ncbi:MAG: electron transfer flavoprotein subunit alpha/FixB family protein, partial [Gammaproteobacteria bacterium]
MSLPRRTRPPRGNGEKKRRDPRAEYNAAADEIVAREEAPAAPGTRTRRDPRAERGPATRKGENPRLDRARPLRLVEDTAAPDRSEPETGPRTIIINEPACWVLAIPDLIEGRLSEHDRDIFGAARTLAEAHGGAVVAVVFDDNPELGSAGADRVMHFGASQAGRYDRDWCSAAICAAIETLRPRHIVFPDNDGAGGDLGRRAAAALGEMPATRVQSVAAD